MDQTTRSDAVLHVLHLNNGLETSVLLFYYAEYEQWLEDYYYFTRQNMNNGLETSILLFY